MTSIRRRTRPSGLGIARTQAPGLYQALTGTWTPEALTDTPVGGLKMLPAGEGLAAAGIELPRIDGFSTACGTPSHRYGSPSST